MWPLFGKELLILFYLFVLCLNFVILVISHIGFKDETLVPIAPVPGHCFLFTLTFKIPSK